MINGRPVRSLGAGSGGGGGRHFVLPRPILARRLARMDFDPRCGRDISAEISRDSRPAAAAVDVSYFDHSDFLFFSDESPARAPINAGGRGSGRSAIEGLAWEAGAF
jgi:hypothetical protein